MTAETWYRYHDWRTGDEWGSSATVSCQEFRVEKHTPKGVQLYMGYKQTRFVLKAARKRFACPTKDEAMDSFRARKKRQLSILRARADHVEEVLRLINGEKGPFE